jgi:hypothetical protein
LINEVAKLADNLDQLAHEEEKYGNTSSDDDENTRSSTSSSPQDSLSNSELVDIESETENTSVSSSSLQPVVESQGSVAVEDEQHEPVHIPCLQCGIKVLSLWKMNSTNRCIFPVYNAGSRFFTTVPEKAVSTPHTPSQSGSDMRKARNIPNRSVLCVWSAHNHHLLST